MHEGNVFLPKVNTMHSALTMQSECCVSTYMLGEIHQHILEVCVSLHQREGLGPAYSRSPELGEGSIPTDGKTATKNGPTIVLSKSLPRSSHTEQRSIKDFHSLHHLKIWVKLLNAGLGWLSASGTFTWHSNKIV